MREAQYPKHLPAFISKMEREALPPEVIDTFSFYYRKVAEGETGLIRNSEIRCVPASEIDDFRDLSAYSGEGRGAMARAVMIVLNGGLGTSMGLTGPKSLLEAKDGKSFLEIIVGRAEARGVELCLMNSFSTQGDTVRALKRIRPASDPLMFLQHKFPKILRNDLSPVSWHSNPAMEWNPPGHGDVYAALHTSGVLDRLLESGIRYAFISNSDNLGAAIDESLLGFFSAGRFPFMMEVAERTPSDLKGGHLARHESGRLILREAAQCPDEDMEAFTDLGCFGFFNTNNIWINLEFLKDLLRAEKIIKLPLILNPKTVDPRDEKSPPVYHVETAMGAAIELFEGAAAVRVPKSRFLPVKKCNDLLAIRSDLYLLSPEKRMVLNPERECDDIRIHLDPKFYGKIDQIDRRFGEGTPSLVACESLSILGDVRFERNVVIRGKVRIRNTRADQAVIKAGTVIAGDMVF